MSLKIPEKNIINPVDSKMGNELKRAGNKISKKTDKDNDDKVIYDKVTIEKLKEKSDRAYQNLRNIVEELLRKQGLSFKRLEQEKELEIKIDDETRAKAKEAIEEGGEYSAETVSDRIVDFAKAISGGDKEKFDLLKDAIEEGFEQARDAFGGELPEISNRTYDLVMEKLENWKMDDQEKIEPNMDTNTSE